MDLTKLSDKDLSTLHRQTASEISRLDNLQMAKKIQLNSAYGALG
jgi:DNA polymerase elongation subunit (family B)